METFADSLFGVTDCDDSKNELRKRNAEERAINPILRGCDTKRPKIWAGISDLEVRLQRELHNPRVEGRGVLAEVTRAKVAADLVELGVIPRIESLDAEFQSAATSLAEDEALEQREVPVVATGPTHRVVAQIAKRTQRRKRKGRGIEVLDDLVPSTDRPRIRNLADQVGTVGGVGQAVTRLAAGEADVDR
jgi:hypothetical protein